MPRFFSMSVLSMSVLVLAAALTARADEAAPAKEKGKYTVYTWFCTRSIREAAVTSDLNQVYNAVETARKQGLKIQVATGNHSQGKILRGSTPSRIQVYVNGCRGGWRMFAEADTEAKANARLETGRPFGSTLLVAVFD
jgi:hypothetical protein